MPEKPGGNISFSLMKLQHRIDLLVDLGEYISRNESEWQAVCVRAEQENPWFTQPFTGSAVRAIRESFLDAGALKRWTSAYALPEEIPASRNVGIVMAGNIPLVGFHDFLAVFVSGHRQRIKASSKDQVLIKHLVAKLTGMDSRVAELVTFSEHLRDCDAYITTGSNNSSRYFEYYFGKYPNIIRRNRTSAGILSGKETEADLQALADDVHLYFGLGCRNITKIFVPEGYDFEPLLQVFGKYAHLAEHHRYKNNYDYNLALLILNKKFYMTNGSVLLVEDPSFFSPISQLHYSFYREQAGIDELLRGNADIQCIAGSGHLAFGSTQHPSLTEYADGVDTMAFLRNL